jgi:hypothetical protein
MAQYNGGPLSYNPQKGVPHRPVELKKWRLCRGTFIPVSRYSDSPDEATQETVMGRGLLLWLIGIPLPIILLIWVLGGLHG